MKYINYNIKDQVADIEIDNQKQLNALNKTLLIELSDIVSKLE